MNIQDAIDAFAQKFVLNGTRTVGLEYEYPMVLADGRPAPRQAVARLWGKLQARGWEPYYDGTTEQVVAVEKDGHMITTDAGIAILEIGLAATETLHQSADSTRALVQLVTALLAEDGVILLGYGVQPVAAPSLANLAPRGRYNFLADDLAQGTAYRDALRVNGGQPVPAYDFGLYTLSAALQTHVDVALDEAITAVNVLNALSGLRVALLANSPVWQGEASYYKASRELFWEWGWLHRANQTGIPPRFCSVEHYVAYVLDFQDLMIKRGTVYYKLDAPLPFREFFTSGRAHPATSTSGQQIDITAERDDVHFQCGMAWINARLQSAHGTVEDRVACQQPPDAPFAAPALTLGLVTNLQESSALINSLSLDQWRAIRLAACARGMAFEYPGVDTVGVLREMVDVARRGLEARGCDEAAYLDPLYERLATRRGPADDALEWFAAGGVPALVERSDLRRMLG